MTEPAGARGIAPRLRRARPLWWTGLALAFWIVATVTGVLPGFLVPPAILAGQETTLRNDADRFPPGTEFVEIPLPSGDRLRGVYVPSDPGAPIVLHLLESSGSVASTSLGYRPLLAALADGGFASLMVDYRGVGASDGGRSPRHLEDDAWAMWSEALRRTGGDPGLVAVRAISIGTLAAASLADRGARPAAWILLAPVRAETVVRHFAAWQFPGVLGQLASRFFRPPTNVDLVASVANMRPHLWVESPDGDELLPDSEQADLHRAVDAAGGAWGRAVDEKMRKLDQDKNVIHIRFFASHVFTSNAAHDLFPPEETALYASAFPHWPDREAHALAVLAELPPGLTERFDRGTDARKRLDELASDLRRAGSVRLAAAALGVEDVEIARQILRMDVDSQDRWLHHLDLDGTLRVLDCRDPAGELPEPLLLDWVRNFSSIRKDRDAVSCELSLRRILELARSSEAAAASGVDPMRTVVGLRQWTSELLPCGALWRVLLVDRGLSRADARRQATRILLKAAAIPDRIVDLTDGGARLEVRDGSTWARVDLDEPSGKATDRPGADAALPR